MYQVYHRSYQVLTMVPRNKTITHCNRENTTSRWGQKLLLMVLPVPIAIIVCDAQIMSLKYGTKKHHVYI